jgi:hypothetical protein
MCRPIFQSHYNVWVRGYGLVDLAKFRRRQPTHRGPRTAAAAEYYPPI